MGVLRNLFSRPVTARELKTALLRVERERRKKQAELKRLSAERDDVIERVRKARKSGDRFEVDSLWEDLKQHKIEAALTRREARILTLEAIAVKRYAWGLERLERSRDKDGVRRLLDRVRKSRLADLLARDEIDEREYRKELESVLEVAGAEAMADAEDDDPEKARFLAEIDAINRAEDDGDFETASERESRLRAEMEDEDGGAA
ncbi:MAG: hypothetical protein JXP34_06455 [Planctomycetes bacterium]|nr:hypothetical protein [Planctomycetota bacterium]